MKQKTRIVFFGSDYPPTTGGISTHTFEWLRAISEEGGVLAQARIFGNKNPRTEVLNDSMKITLVKSVSFFYVGWRVFLDILSNQTFEVMHSFNLFPVGFWVIFWARIFGKKGIVTFYGADACDKRTSKKVLWLQKWTLSHADSAITISEFTKNKVIERYKLSGENIKVIHPLLPRYEKNTEDIDLIRAKFNIKPDDFVVLAVCRLVKRKGIEYLIDAAGMIKDQSVKIIVVGGGPEKDALEAKVEHLSLTDKVFFAGKVPSLPVYYSLADISVLVSYIIPEEGDFEGLGLVLLEAQSHGLPVIGSRSGGIPEAFDDTKTGILVPERDADALAQAIVKLKEDKVLYQRMSENCPDFLERNFGLENTVGKYLRSL